MSKLTTHPVNEATAKEFITIDERDQSSNGCLRIITYIDKDTNQHIAYVPSLEVTGYGNTETEARDLLWVAIEKFFDHLFSPSVTRIYDELSKLGWKRSWYKKKEFSRTYIDVTGELKEFALEDSIRTEELQIA